MTHIELPEGMTAVPANAFQGSNHLMKVVLPSTILCIQENAFRDCTRLKQVNLPDGLEEIHLNAFRSTALTAIDVPATVTYLSGFYGCKQLTDVHLREGLEEIGIYAFDTCTSLVGLDIPDGVKTVSSYAFSNCQSLKSIDLPASVMTIGEQCFYICTSLESFGYPAGWAKVYGRHNNWNLYGGNIFEGCSKLTSITIPEGVTEIPNYAFAGSAYLQEINFPETLEIIHKGAFERCTALNKVELPQNLKTLRLNVFRDCTNLEDVIFNDGLESVQAGCFANCTSLVDADLPDSVEEIGELCFENCTALESFDYPMSWAKVTSRHDNGHLYGGGTFSGCTKLTSYTIPEGVTTIPDSAFAGFTSLKEIHFPSTLITIGSGAFERCKALTVVELPQNLKTLRLSVFRDCTNLKDVIFNDGLESVQAGCFAGCISLVEADLPDSVKEIGELCFENCTALQTFDYPMSWTSVTSRYDNGHLYGGGTFTGCEKLTSLTIPEGVTAIPDYAFAGSNYLKEVSLPSTLEIIGRWVFERCTELTYVQLPANVKILKLRAFYGCSKLKDVAFPDGLEEVHAGCFGNCPKLLEADLPHSVKTIGEECFINCTSLNYFNYPLSLEYVNSRYENGHLYGGNTFTGCESLTSVVVPEGVRFIPAALFEGANYLQSISLPSTLTEIRSTAFAGCTILPKIYLSPAVTSIADNAFNNCPALRIYCEYGSVALQYAIRRGIPYFYLSLTGASYPSGTLYRGNVFSLYGYVRSSELISNVTATIYNADGSQVLQQVIVSPYVLDYGLAGEIHSALRFQDLPLGSYCYTLVATAGEETEVLQSTTFQVVPPPLSIQIHNLVAPEGMYGSAAGVYLGGNIMSNYPITSVQIQLVNTATAATLRQVNATPGSYSYDLSNAAGQLALSSLGDGLYMLRVVAVSNGETRVLCERDFHILAGAGEITEEMHDALIAFAKNSSNRDIFTGRFASAVINDIHQIDALIYIFDQLVNFSLKDVVLNVIRDKGQSRELIDMYKHELISMINSVNYDQFMPNVDYTGIADKIVSTAKTSGKIVKEYVEDESVKTFIDVVNTVLEKLGLFTESTDKAMEAYEHLVSIILNVDRGVRYLDYLSQSIGIAVHDELATAVYELKESYISDSSAAMYEIADIILKAEIETGSTLVDILVDLLKDKAEKKEFLINFSLAKTLAKLGLKFTDLHDDVTESYRTFFVRYDILRVSTSSFLSAFDRVRDGDHSGDALSALSTAIYITRSAWDRHYEAIKGIRSAVYTIAYEAQVYRDSSQYQALNALVPAEYQ